MENKEKKDIENLKEEKKQDAVNKIANSGETVAVIGDDGSKKTQSDAANSAGPSRSPDEVSTESIPLPRESGVIKVDFTPREFPTPSRESTVIFEEEWIQAQQEQIKGKLQQEVKTANEPSVAVELPPEQMSMLELKTKAWDYLTKKDYLGAEKVYTQGIYLEPHLPDMYALRANTYYKMKVLRQAIDDATKAIGLFKEPIGIHAMLRAKTYMTRGMARWESGEKENGQADIQMVTKLFEEIHKPRSK